MWVPTLGRGSSVESSPSAVAAAHAVMGWELEVCQPKRRQQQGSKKELVPRLVSTSGLCSHAWET